MGPLRDFLTIDDTPKPRLSQKLKPAGPANEAIRGLRLFLQAGREGLPALIGGLGGFEVRLRGCAASTRSLVSLVSRTTASIDVRAATGGAETRITESREPIRGLAWTNEGGILYPRGSQLVVRGSDGRERIVLESDVNSPPANPEVCPGRARSCSTGYSRMARQRRTCGGSMPTAASRTS